MIIHKFGGTSVGDAAGIARVAEILAHHRSDAPGEACTGAGRPGSGEGASPDRPGAIPSHPGRLVVVVSAMSGVTDQLIEGARAAAAGDDIAFRDITARLRDRHRTVTDTLLSNNAERIDTGGFIEDRLYDLERLYRSLACLGELTARGRDAVAAHGEPLSARIVAAVLRERGIPAQPVSATELIVTDDRFGEARPLPEPTRRRLREIILPLLDRGVTPVVTGYIAATAAGVTTTLGRGGSDFTAALVGAGLDAEAVWIWSDVDGILTADPNLVPSARPLAELSYAEAAELAYYGAEVLHPKTVWPLVERGIPLRIRNTFQPDHPGTRIVARPDSARTSPPAIISATGLTLIAAGSAGDGWNPRQAARALTRLAEGGVEVLMFSQSFSEHSLNLVVREPDHAHGLELLRREFIVPAAGEGPACPPPRGRADDPQPAVELGVRENVATISVVGLPDGNGASLLPQVFASLGRQGTRIIAVAQAAREHSASFCVPEDQMAEAVRRLHRELGLEGGHA